MSFVHELDIFKSLRNHLFFVTRSNSFHPGIEQEVLFNSQDVPQNIELRADSNLQLDHVHLRLKAVPSDPCVAISRGVYSSQLLDQSRLSSTIWSKQTKKFSRVNFEGDVFICNFRLESTEARVNFPNVLHDERIFKIVVSWQIIHILPFGFGVEILLDKL